MKSRLCITVAAETTAELRRLRDEAAASADLVELRLDSVRDPSVAGAIEGRTAPVLVTCRPAWEGGAFKGPEETRRQLLSDAWSLGAEYVDVEWRAGMDDLIARAAGRRIVLSMHDFDGVPDDLGSRVRAMRSTGAQVIKLAVTANRLSDCVRLREIAPQAADRHDGRILIAMGDYGLPTRILASRFGSAWTYAGPLRAAGQVTARALLDDYHFRAITDATEVYGVVGGSVGHSVSPAMHNAAFRAVRYDAVYLPLPAISADDFMAFGRAIGLHGASVTVPHKVTLFDRLDEVDAVARRIGAINTIWVRKGHWLGSNSDAIGFLAPLQDRVNLRGLRAAVLGAGGAARAVGVALASRDCAVRFHARRRDQAEQVGTSVAAEAGGWPPEPGSWDILINCTPVGQFPRVDETPLPMDHLTGRYVYDLVYNPPMTRLLREAQVCGCQIIGGLDMLVSQAEEQFRCWTGSKPPAGVMRTAALGRLAEQAHDENHVV